MAILTKFLQLLKPEKNDYVDVEKHLSENYDKIDAKLEELSNSNDEKLNKGNVPDVLNSAEKIIKALQGNTGIKFDENLLYLNDEGTKKAGFCYLDRLTDGIFECIQETTTKVNDNAYFKNFSNKENSDRLSNLMKINSSANDTIVKYSNGLKEIYGKRILDFNVNGGVHKILFPETFSTKVIYVNIINPFSGIVTSVEEVTTSNFSYYYSASLGATNREVFYTAIGY